MGQTREARAPEGVQATKAAKVRSENRLLREEAQKIRAMNSERSKSKGKEAQRLKQQRAEEAELAKLQAALAKAEEEGRGLKEELAKLQADQVGWQEDAVKLSEKNEEEAEAATKLQSLYRGKQTRKEVQKRAQLKSKDAAGPRVQTEQVSAEGARLKAEGVETPLAEEAVRVKSSDKKLEEAEAATKVQSLYRGKQTRKEMQKRSQLKSKDAVGLKVEAAQVTEEGGRLKAEGVETLLADEAVRLKSLDKKREAEAATKVQSMYRGKQSRKEVQKRVQLKSKDAAGLEGEAGQATEEGARLKAEGVETLLPEEAVRLKSLDKKQEEAQTATKVQSLYRGKQTRKEVQKRKQELNSEEGAKLQAQEDGAQAEAEMGKASLKARGLHLLEEMKLKAEEEAKLKSLEDEAQAPAEIQEASLKAGEEMKLKAQEEAGVAEEARPKQEEETRLVAEEEEVSQNAEEKQATIRRAEEEAIPKVEEEARPKAV